MPEQLTATAAAQLLKPGQRVFIQGGVGEPQTLLAALANDPNAADGVEFIAPMVPGLNTFIATDFHPRASFVSFFIFGGLYDSFQTGRTRYLPLHYSQIIPYLHSLPRLDAALIQVSPPDAQGRCNLGMSADFVPALLDRGITLIAELNARMPAAIGSPSVAFNALDYVVECDHPLPTEGADNASRETLLIAQQVAALIDDGDTLQFGIGAIPRAVLAQLGNHRQLGIHSGLINEAVQPLIDGGNVTGERKTIDRNMHVTGYALGSEPFYQWAAQQRDLRFAQVSHTHDIRVISALDNFVSINSAVQVDLLGQANSEMLNGRQISGTGGALDFIRGARLSKNGRSILALPATAAKGTQSRIVARLAEDSVVTVPRTDIDYVVTEYGVARLSSLSTRERATALIDIAAPQFRAALAEQAQC